MTLLSPLSNPLPAPPVSTAAPLFPARDPAVPLGAAAEHLLSLLERGERVDAPRLRSAMERAFSATDASGAWTRKDASGAWSWKAAYDACEVAQVLFLRKYGAAMRARAGRPEALLSMVSRIADLLPTQTRCSEESQALRQFSTPLPLAFVAAQAAGIGPEDVVLEPSAGTGLMAVFAERAGARLVLRACCVNVIHATCSKSVTLKQIVTPTACILPVAICSRLLGICSNEIGRTRAALLRRLFPGAVLSSHEAAAVDDRLAEDVRPSEASRPWKSWPAT
ncbi:hypothetical protein [Rhodospirillum sp. A1_3_36]|uniref:hypothetical protein n=1 Tax=Rhodospirillum sp. A1_3_36 TaxID=3391666 RepID=UPI0039A6B511